MISLKIIKSQDSEFLVQRHKVFNQSVLSASLWYAMLSSLAVVAFFVFNVVFATTAKADIVCHQASYIDERGFTKTKEPIEWICTEGVRGTNERRVVEADEFEERAEDNQRERRESIEKEADAGDTKAADLLEKERAEREAWEKNRATPSATSPSCSYIMSSYGMCTDADGKIVNSPERNDRDSGTVTKPGPDDYVGPPPASLDKSTPGPDDYVGPPPASLDKSTILPCRYVKRDDSQVAWTCLTEQGFVVSSTPTPPVSSTNSAGKSIETVSRFANVRAVRLLSRGNIKGYLQATGAQMTSYHLGRGDTAAAIRSLTKVLPVNSKQSQIDKFARQLSKGNYKAAVTTLKAINKSTR